MTDHKAEILKSELEGLKELAEYMLEQAEQESRLQEQVKQIIKLADRMLRIVK